MIEQRSLDGLIAADEVRDVLGWMTTAVYVDDSAARQRGPWDLSPSKLAGCSRRAAYAIAQVEPSDTPSAGENCAATNGTWLHAGFLPGAQRRITDAVIEQEVFIRVAGLTVHPEGMAGHLDLGTDQVVGDLKTVSQYRMAALRQVGADLAHWVQVWTYALGRHQNGHHPRWVAIIYLDRTTGDREIFVEPYTVRSALAVINRAVELREYAADPDSAPRADVAGKAILGPGFGYSCDECPFLRHCWGEDATPGRFTPRTYDNAEVEQLLREYLAARAAETAATRRKEELATLLGSVRTGVYGAIRYGRSQSSEVVDTAAAAKLLEDLGFDVPMTIRRGSLNIRPVAAVTGGDCPRVADAG